MGKNEKQKKGSWKVEIPIEEFEGIMTKKFLMLLTHKIMVLHQKLYKKKLNEFVKILKQCKKLLENHY